MNFRDAELLSAYLDGRLSPSEASRLEARLSTDKNLKTTFEELRQTRALLRQLPQRRAPRNFRLTPKMAGIRPPEPRGYPVFRLATALVALLFVVSVGLNAVVPFAASRFAPAAQPALGMGGGGGGSGGAAESKPATEAPLQAPFAAQAAPTATPEDTLSAEVATAAPPQAEDTMRALATEQAAAKAPPAQPPVAQRGAAIQPVPVVLIVALGVLMLLCAAVAWMLRSNSDRRIRSRWNHK